MARIPFVIRDDVEQNERPAFDAFVKERGKVPDAGPYALLLHIPEVAQRLESLRVCIREEKSLSQKIQELVMLTVAREMDCAYIWHAHAAIARETGVRNEIVDNLREKRALTGLDPDQQAAVDFARELLQTRKVTEATFERAKTSFGRRGTLTLTSLISAYAMLAYVMNAYALEAPEHATEKALPL